MTTLVKRILDRRIEDKHIIWNVENLTPHNATISTADCVSLLQDIAQGTAENERVGDKIKPKYLRVNGVISLANSTIPGGFTFTDPITVRVMAFTQNDVKVATQSSSVDTGNLLRGMNAQNTSFDGQTVKLMLPINTDKFKKIFDRQATLCPSWQVGGSPSPGNAWDLNDRTMFKFSFKVKLPATLKYDIANGNYANNFAPWLGVGYAFAGGRQVDNLATPIYSTVTSHLIYEDA